MTLQKLRVSDATHFNSHELATILNRCFEGYLVPFTLEGEMFASRFAAESLSLADSRIWFEGETPIALALITRRGWRSRLAVFAIRPQWRGNGYGKAMMQSLLAEARARGDNEMIVEVIKGNDPAQRLYESVGFTREYRLRSFTSVGAAEQTASLTLQPFDPERVAGMIMGEPHALPWLIHPLTALALPGVGVALEDNAFAIVNTLFKEPQLRALYVTPEARGQGYASRLLAQLAAAFPGIIAPCAVPDELSGLFERNGWREQNIQQYQLRQTL
ncbi:GNAT family N-acetyltransferase [Franconibacter daqui]|uniref:GNAT family N-acetyltransferase n=1 Tax=Franconibacter daqui TaxID=2047724 RepID=UPI002DBDD6AC|nr:GNAT family N-acetyltransferase [Franconibacter daqui]MEB5922354.1 GNAT family N-acetyltransferase [Franconibacter daqui]